MAAERFNVKCVDGRVFEDEMLESVRSMCTRIDKKLEDKKKKKNHDGIGITVLFFAPVRGEMLEKVIQYCNKHVNTSPGEDDDDLKAWDDSFVEPMHLFTAAELVRVATYLGIPSLRRLARKAVGRKFASFVGKEEKEEEDEEDEVVIEHDEDPDEEEFLQDKKEEAEEMEFWKAVEEETRGEPDSYC